MAVKMISLKCPDCGADLDFEEGRKQVFCSYCGSRIMMDNDHEFTYRYIDEAAVNKVNAEKILKQQQLDTGKRVAGFKFLLAASTSVAAVLMMVAGFGLGNLSNNEDSAWYMLSLIGMLVMVGSVHLWISFNHSLDEVGDYGDKIRIPEVTNYEQQNHLAIKAMFETAGFTNIRSVPLHDLKLGLLKKDGSVDSIVIEGNRITGTERNRFSPDVPVIINYHSH